MRFHTQTAGRQPDRAAAAEQHRPHGDRGARRRARRHPVAAHQLLRRGARAADRGGGADRAAHPAGDRPRDRRREHDRPARRQLLRRGADRPRWRPQAYDYFRRIDELGGMVEAVKQNFPQREIADASYELQQEIDAGRRIVVGVNAYTEDGDGDQTPILRIDPALERKQIDRVQGVRARRDGAAVESTPGRAPTGGRDRRQPHAAAARLRPRPRQRGRDDRRAPAGLRPLHRDAGLLSRWPQSCPASSPWRSRRSLLARSPATRRHGRVTVKLKDSFFSPSHVTLSRGGSVRFVWAGELTHNLLGPGIPEPARGPRDAPPAVHPRVPSPRPRALHLLHPSRHGHDRPRALARAQAPGP